MFTRGEEEGGSIPFLDTLIQRWEDGNLKLEVYCKETHTNQYLAFDSHHPLYQKMGVVRTWMDRCEKVVPKEEDKIKEKETISEILKVCRYLQWTITLVNEKMAKKEGKKKSESGGEREEQGDNSCPLYERVGWEDNMGDEKEKDQYSHATSHYS